MDRAVRPEPRPGGGYGAAERRRIRAFLTGLGLTEHQLLEPLAAELRQRGCRPRQAWRLANELTQSAVADHYNRITDNPQATMRASRISEYEAWPAAGASVARPTLRVLKILSTIYGTSWEQLVDLADLELMPAAERLEFQEAVARRSDDRTRPSVSAGLPPEVPHFTGRAGPKKELRDRVQRHLCGEGPAVHVIDGLTGIGKTALARYAVVAFAEHYPDGTIWADLHGHTVGRDPRLATDVLEQLLLEIEIPRERIMDDLTGRATQWRAAMRQRRMLIVFDNVLDSAQVRLLLPQASGCLVLITSRGKLTGLAEAAPLHLDVMGWREAEELLVKLGNLPSRYDRGAVRQILETSGRLPLAIRLIGGQIAHHGVDLLAESAAEFATRAEELKGNQGPQEFGESVAAYILDRFAAEDESLRAAFETSYQRLQTPAQRRGVRMLGWFPGPEITAETLATMAQTTLGEAKTLIRQMFEAGFLDPAEGGPGGSRYRMHDLTRLLARLHAERDAAPGEHAVVLARLIAAGLAVARRVGPQRSSVSRWGPSYPAADAGDSAVEQAMAWLTREREMLLGCIGATGPTVAAAELAILLGTDLFGEGHWSDARWLYLRALDMATALADPAIECDALNGLGHVERMACAYRTAHDYFERALTIARDLGDPERLAVTIWGYAEVIRRTGDFERARQNYSDAAAIALRTANAKLHGDAVRGQGHIERMTGDLVAAQRHYQEALRIARRIGDRAGECWSLWGLGNIARKSGEYGSARKDFIAAYRIASDINDFLCQVDTLRGLGHVERRFGEYESARDYYAKSRELAQRIRDPHGEADALQSLGNVLADMGSDAEARDNLCAALALYEQLGVQLTERTRADIGRYNCQ
ncbi:tetratricopeptide repeat protein [Nocardia bhagyanarayanae]|uniref:Tetratricopeptide repeat protein n=1 Tax=Nocardia bhagyanarayanae TaxID=1215925 RepID=A0A543F8K4_9NOCA|nr:tetratricopeptide repeat protein [Nocardia bhagyanarayanae]TQM30159.1 tetratricopeptide repeat protein [Nocardia bhagyanarayanae]